MVRNDGRPDDGDFRAAVRNTEGLQPWRRLFALSKVCRGALPPRWTPELEAGRLVRAPRGGPEQVSASSMSKSVAVSIRAWLRVHNHRIVAQLPPKMPSQRLRPKTSSRSQPLGSNSPSRSVKSFGLEVNGVQPSPQPPTVSGPGVQRGQVVLALARHFKARLPKRGDDIEAGHVVQVRPLVLRDGVQLLLKCVVVGHAQIGVGVPEFLEGQGGEGQRQ